MPIHLAFKWQAKALWIIIANYDLLISFIYNSSSFKQDIKARMTRIQAKMMLITLQGFLIFIVVSVIANMIVSAQLGVSPQDGPPDHDTPWGCSQIKHKSCTTREGKCTVDKRQCVYPELNEQCEYLMLVDKLKKYQRKSLKAKYENITLRQQKLKLYGQYCGDEAIFLFMKVEEDLSDFMLDFEVSLTLVLTLIFYPQISQFAHNKAYN